MKDKCSECHGEKGGEPGNENWVDGRLLCDYCHASWLNNSLHPEAVAYREAVKAWHEKQKLQK